MLQMSLVGSCMATQANPDLCRIAVPSCRRLAAVRTDHETKHRLGSHIPAASGNVLLHMSSGILHFGGFVMEPIQPLKLLDYSGGAAVALQMLNSMYGGLRAVVYMKTPPPCGN